MRESDQLINDMIEMSAIEWNRSLADEYNLSFEEFLIKVSNYEYTPISEDNIHNKLLMSSLNKSENINGDINIESTFRDLTQIEFDSGDVLDQMILCGFIFNLSLLSGLIIKNTIFNNCICNGGDFTFTKIIQSKFIDCNFHESDFSNCIVTKSAFYECNFSKTIFNNVNFYDCVFYNCNFYDADLDYTGWNSSLMHDINFDNASMKNVMTISSSFSNCSFNNSNLTNSSLLDCNLIMLNLTKSNLDKVFTASNMYSSVDIDKNYLKVFGIKSDEDDDIDFNEDDDDD